MATTWSRNEVKRMVENLERGFIGVHGTREELEELYEQWAKDGDGHGRTKDELWRRYANLRALIARKVAEKKALSGLGIETETADAEALAALNEEPAKVTLSNGDTVEVHPKSWATLNLLAAHEHVLTWLVVRREILASMNQPDQQELLERTDAEINRRMAGLLATVVRPGPGHDLEELRNPEETDAGRRMMQLSPQDAVLLQQAHLRVNFSRLAVLPALVGSDTKEGRRRLSWSGMFAQLGMKLRLNPKELMTDRSLPSLLAQIRLGNGAAASEELEEALGQ